MSALAEPLEFHLPLAGMAMPVTLRLSRTLNDLELMAFSRRNRPFRVEQNAEGDLEIMPPLGLQAGQREAFVMGRLGNWADEHGGLAFSCNVGVILRDKSIRSPDALWMSQALWDGLSKDEQKGFAPVCPELLVEILSESDSRVKLEEKMEVWIANGAQMAWMIDPFAAEVLVYRPGQSV